MVTISDTNEALLKAYFANSKIVRIYNPTSITVKEKRICCEKNDTFVYVGRVSKEKGLDYLCNEFLDSSKVLIIIGDGDSLSELKKSYKSENIIFVGRKEHSEVLEYLKRARALIFPSLLYEGAPLSIFEALSYGIPCIVSKYSNARDFIDYDNGWIYDPLSMKCLKEIVENLNDDEVMRKSTYAYNNYWKNPFTREKYIVNFINLIKKV